MSRLTELTRNAALDRRFFAFRTFAFRGANLHD